MYSRVVASVWMIAAVLAVGSAGAAESTLDQVKRNGEIRIGYRESGFPFSFIDEQKEIKGYAIDLCHGVVVAIKKELKLPALKVTYVPVTAKERMAAIQENKIDLECATTTNTEDRKKQVAFAPTMFVTTVGFLTKHGAAYNDFTNFDKKRVVAVKGSTAEAALKRYGETYRVHIEVVEAKDTPDAMRKLEGGEALAFANDDILLQGVRSRAKSPDDWRVMSRFMSYDPIAIMFRKDDAKLESFLFREIGALYASGEGKKLYSKWFTTATLNVPLSDLQAENFARPNDRSAWSM